MKKALLILNCFLMFFISHEVFGGVPEERMVPVDSIYAPDGFDSNDNVEIVVTGYLPNMCHKSPTAKAVVENKKVKIVLTSLYYEENNPFCPEMAVPFTKTVRLGLLEPGRYDILVNEKSENMAKETLDVFAHSADSIDTFTYAYVDYVEKNEKEGKVFLKGYHLSDCFELDRIEYFTNGKNVYSILPILKKTSDFCPRKMLPFKFEFIVPRDFAGQKTLLHVRTMNGNSVNTIYNDQF